MKCKMKSIHLCGSDLPWQLDISSGLESSECCKKPCIVHSSQLGSADSWTDVRENRCSFLRFFVRSSLPNNMASSTRE